jgi:hypothetical protein
MLKSGWIAAAVSLLLALGVTLVLPYCVPCLALLLGLGAGYLAGVFDRPALKAAAVRSGTLAGLIGGAGVVIGQMGATLINGFSVGPQGMMDLYNTLGITPGVPVTPQFYWVSLIGGNGCLALVSVGLMAGLGALGGLLWWQVSGQKLIPPPTPLPPQ